MRRAPFLLTIGVLLMCMVLSCQTSKSDSNEKHEQKKEDPTSKNPNSPSNPPKEPILQDPTTPPSNFTEDSTTPPSNPISNPQPHAPESCREDQHLKNNKCMSHKEYCHPGHWQKSSSSCVSCGFDEIWKKDKCISHREFCGPSKHWDGHKCGNLQIGGTTTKAASDQCKPNQQRKSKKCIDCNKSDQYWDGTKCIHHSHTTCPKMAFWNGSDCLSCRRYERWNGTGCVECGENKKWEDDEYVSCRKDEHWNGTECQSCDEDQIFKDGKCIYLSQSCGTWEDWDYDLATCKECTDSFGHSTKCKAINTCVQGLSGFSQKTEDEIRTLLKSDSKTKKKFFNTLRIKYHPDKCKLGKAECNENMQKINACADRFPD